MGSSVPPQERTRSRVTLSGNGMLLAFDGKLNDPCCFRMTILKVPRSTGILSCGPTGKVNAG